MTQLNAIESLGPIKDEATLIALVESAQGLKSLSVSGPGVTDRLIEACSKKNTLRSLYLSGPLDGSGLAKLVDQPISKSLKYLGLTTEPLPQGGTAIGEVFGLSEQGIQAIAQLDRLEELSLCGCGLNDKGLESIAELPELQVLAMDGNPILGSGLKKFSGHKRLRLISASYCRISDVHLDEFPRLPRMQILDLGGNPIGDTVLERISDASGSPLIRLSLGGTRITGAGLSCLSVSPNLEELELNDAAVTGRQLSRLRGLPIRRLDLSRTACHGEGVGSLLEFKSLESLALADTKLSGSNLEGLAKLEKLVYLNLAGLQIKKEIVESLRRKLRDVEIDMKHLDGNHNQLIPGGRASIRQR